MSDEPTRIQITDYDSFLSEPTLLDNFYGKVQKVPIIRIYGTLEIKNNSNDGQAVDYFNVLVHVHNCFPYFYVGVDSKFNDILNEDSAAKILHYLEEQLSNSFKRNKGTEDLEYEENDDVNIYDDYVNNVDDSGQKRNYVASVSFCRGVPIYGFATQETAFIKISLLSPMFKSRLVNLINEKKLNPIDPLRSRVTRSSVLLYEAHIPFLLQFLADFNLYSCNWLAVDKLFFRHPIFANPSTDFLSSIRSVVTKFLKKNEVLNPSLFPRIGRSLIEVDVLPEYISNRRSIKQTSFDDSSSFTFKDSRLEIAKRVPSLNDVYEDLKYQCQVRNYPFKELSLSQKSLGAGGTIWSNSYLLNDLLSYMIFLTKKSSARSYDEYMMALPPKDISFLATSFDLMDRSISKNVLRYSGYRSLTIKWTDLSELIGNQSCSIESQLSDRYTQVTPESNMKQNAGILERNDVVLENSDPENDNNVLPEYNLDVANEDSFVNENINRNLDHELMTQFSQCAHNSQYSTSLLHSSLIIPGKGNESDIHSNYQGTQAPAQVYEILKSDVLNKSSIMRSLESLGIPSINYTDPAYEESDSSTQEVEVAPVNFSREASTFESSNSRVKMSSLVKRDLCNQSSWKSEDKTIWQYTVPGPSKELILSFLDSEKKYQKSDFFKNRSSMLNSYHDANKASPSLSNLYLEVHSNTFNDLLPNPLKDPISMLVYKFDNPSRVNCELEECTGLLIYDPENFSDLKYKLKGLTISSSCHLDVFDDELSMFDSFISIVVKLDPDLLTGYEVHSSSWGYLIERYNSLVDGNILALLGRCITSSEGIQMNRWGYTHSTSYKFNGRHMINLWRVLKSDVSLTSYALENLSQKILHQTFPRYSNKQLSLWLRSSRADNLSFVSDYYFKRIDVGFSLLKSRKIISKTSEQARLTGIDFHSVMNRGSQFKVEAILLRISKPMNVLLNSISKTQLNQMKALECIPLVMEPESMFYKSPLIVLDFQCLYPSVMIAYNYCYSTILGKLHGFNPKKNVLGYLKNLEIPEGLVDVLNKQDALTISPNGCVFVKSFIRKSILAKMLEDLITIRSTIKYTAGLFENEHSIYEALDSRQLALKMISNVTYGYTSASFSGRMPNSDLADSIVASGRELLTKSIRLIEDANLGAKVVYGDTDSLFVYLPGKSKVEAFSIGQELSSLISNSFPDPIKLKFEKVYHPSVLLAKKRYVGLSYEPSNQDKPKFDAKGIETVRRDGIPAQQQIVKESLNILFSTKNLTRVKQYVSSQFLKLMSNEVEIKDFCFAKEVRYGTYKNESSMPPGALVAHKKVPIDPRSVPQYRERVPYLVYMDSSTPRLRDRCVSPEDFVKSFNTRSPLKLDYEYYITKVLIPPLERIFGLMGVDVKKWYRELPKSNKWDLMDEVNVFYISNLVSSKTCVSCGAKVELNSERAVCKSCLSSNEFILSIPESRRNFDRKFFQLYKTCNSCISTNFNSSCSGMLKLYSGECFNRDCAVYYQKHVFKMRSKDGEHKQKLMLSDLNF
ncbi:Piso0_005157 [Millerozyma farinosa CBS 7064]|uniref:DNA polymerase n=1 Tax=Pichia sorbitophila (strain ATCC MYA-4447 / BCRC 22081 / CBS 7064 / NBRC 10061 / NRRL Y-12695) TaxID=559304 RepID=G8Y4D3_PICSO|nr:Piso0_005157 [Millerozyma farinosa CBS 7064]